MRLLVLNLVTDADDPVLGFTTRWIAALAARAERVAVITMRAGRLDVPGNVTVASVGKERDASEPRRFVAFYSALARALHDPGVDACFSHMIPVFSILAAPVLLQRGIPLVTWYAHPRRTLRLRVAHHLSNCMVTSLESAYPYRRDKLFVLGQGIDVEQFIAPPGQPCGVLTVLCAGRLSPVKDQRTLLRAAALLRDRRPTLEFRLAFIGKPATNADEAYAAVLRADTERLGLAAITRFEPARPHAAMPEAYTAAAVHVNLTPVGFGDKVALEAMACGRPSLVANEGFRETLGKHAGELLFRHGDATALAAALERLLDLSAVERSAIGQDLRKNVIALHGLPSLADRLIDLLRGLTQRR